MVDRYGHTHSFHTGFEMYILELLSGSVKLVHIPVNLLAWDHSYLVQFVLLGPMTKV